MLTGGWLLAATAGPAVGTSLVDGLTQNGPWGLAVLGLGWLAYRLINRETQRADRAEQELRELNRDLRDRVVPLLTDVLRKLADDERRR